MSIFDEDQYSILVGIVDLLLAWMFDVKVYITRHLGLFGE
jgi:hypothetical protein